MRGLDFKKIDESINLAYEKEYFDGLNTIYEKVPKGKCSGCTNCCMESVHTHFVEFLNIFNYLRKNEKLYKKLFPKILRYYFLETVKKEHCPFLDEKGFCQIYDYRPLVCRMFGHLTEEEYEESYRNVLRENMDNVEFYNNTYGLIVPDEVANYKIEYCRNFKIHERMDVFDRRLMIDDIFMMESAFFMRELITEEFMNMGLVSWFVYMALDVNEIGELRMKIMKEYLEKGESSTLNTSMKNIEIVL